MNNAIVITKVQKNKQVMFLIDKFQNFKHFTWKHLQICV